MGFINATYELGKLVLNKLNDPEFIDIESYLQLPMPVIEDKERSGRVIRIWLNVIDSTTECIEVKSIEKIDISDYIKTTDLEELSDMKRKLIYREPTRAATPWKFSPIYKLGKGSANSLSDLIGTKGSWQEDNPELIENKNDFNMQEVYIERDNKIRPIYNKNTGSNPVDSNDDDSSFL